MTPAQAKSSLTAASKASVVGIAKVGSGYEGASADASTMHFWRTDASGRWVADGDAVRMPVFTSSVVQSIEGRQIRGAQHAAFILHADIGGTGSSPTAQAYARGAQGWGPVAPTKPDGSAVAIAAARSGDGAWHNASFGTDTLKLNSFVPGIANADGHDVVRSWVMKGDSFELVGTDDPSTKPQHFRMTDWGTFTSPSGKNTCEMSKDSVSCELSAVVMASHSGANMVTLSSRGWSIGAGDRGIDPEGVSGNWALSGGGATPPEVGGIRVLTYGSTITNGSVTCTSSTEGFDCSSGSAGFKVNSQSLSTRGPNGVDVENKS